MLVTLVSTCTLPALPLGWEPAPLLLSTWQICDSLFGLDGEEEFTVYSAPVGTISECDHRQEKAFYQFVEDEGLLA